MKKLFILLFFFITSSCFAQKANKQVVFIKNKNIFISKSVASSKDFSYDFKSDSLNARFKSINPLKIYMTSATIFDASYIVLLEENTFIASFAGCLQQIITSGSYRINKDTLTLNSSKKIFKSVPKKKKIVELKYEFVEIGERNYLITNEGLKHLN